MSYTKQEVINISNKLIDEGRMDEAHAFYDYYMPTATDKPAKTTASSTSSTSSTSYDSTTGSTVSGWSVDTNSVTFNGCAGDDD